ncbi:acid resistance repetitive basic protein Asr [Escherichia fergusonii]|uniref:acid resistance repetitive basic protein Asr n=1 Tax=Escherichia fergusonii TaxID=564 RepID=UPI003FD59951
MKKVLALLVVATMGLSSAVFAAQTATTTAPAKTMHKKHHQAVTQKVPEQKAQAAKKHHKKAKATSVQKAPEQKAQAAKKYTKKHHQQTAKPATQPATQPAA